jgi:apolipoprotein N-acyltransferase
VGGTAATAQHFSLAIFRAVENKRFLARVATAGISGFVDPTGRPYQLSTAERGVVLGQVVPQDGLTVYAQYGDWFACACVLFSFAALLAGQQKILGSRKQL